MKIELIKKVTSPSGKVWKKGMVLSVTKEYGQELIEAGKAVVLGEKAPVEIESNNEKID